MATHISVTVFTRISTVPNKRRPQISTAFGKEVNKRLVRRIPSCGRFEHVRKKMSFTVSKKDSHVRAVHSSGDGRWESG